MHELLLSRIIFWGDCDGNSEIHLLETSIHLLSITTVKTSELLLFIRVSIGIEILPPKFAVFWFRSRIFWVLVLVLFCWVLVLVLVLKQLLLGFGIVIGFETASAGFWFWYWF